MSDIRVHQKSLKDIEDFLTFVIQAKDNSDQDSQLWKNLKGLVETLLATEDKPAKLAMVIKEWCKQFGIALNPEELARYRDSLRVNMLSKQGDVMPVIPAANPGERPAVTLNQALIVDTVNDAIAGNKSDNKPNN